jgi:hypothetical protein
MSQPCNANDATANVTVAGHASFERDDGRGRGCMGGADLRKKRSRTHISHVSRSHIVLLIYGWNQPLSAPHRLAAAI